MGRTAAEGGGSGVLDEDEMMRLIRMMSKEDRELFFNKAKDL